MAPTDAGADLELAVAYDMPGSVLGAIANKLVVEKQNEQEMHAALANLKARLEE